MKSSKVALGLFGAFATSLFLDGCGGNGDSGATGTNSAGPTSYITMVHFGAIAVNNAGGILGQSEYLTPSRATVHFNEVDDYSVPVMSVNDSGVVVGQDLRGEATYWVNGVAAKLKVPAGATSSSATSINDAGQIVGWDQVNTAEPSILYWKSASATPIVLPVKFIPVQIGKNGDVVGWIAPSAANLTGTLTYYRYNVNTGTGPVAIATESSEGTWLPRIALNATGTVVLRTPSNAAVIPVSGPGENIDGKVSNLSINDQGDVVGYLLDSSGSHSFIWAKSRGAVNLATFLPKKSGWTNLAAVSINDNGQVVGNGSLNGVPLQSFLLQLPSGAF